jgi:tol-pal system protein YbgF
MKSAAGSGGRPGRRNPGRHLAVALAGLLVVAAAAATTGCGAPQIALLRSGLDSLRTVVDTLTVRDATAFAVLNETRKEVAEQRDILLSTRASSGTTTQELFEQMGRLESKLDEVMGRFQQISQRVPPPSAPPGTPGAPSTAPALGDPNQLYDQATQDLTQGRYALALQGFRDFVRRFPAAELSDNAQYGVGECFFAQSRFDSAAVEYARVEAGWAKGDRVPAALYKLALSQERLGMADASKKTFGDVVKRFPNSGEAQLARERLGGTRNR